ncbi:MAG TPA: ankyrin repeat domain-containing protein, partial [Archangium sp.]|nr:ankyrin repeat domain-containing protein [Archangium sp.]
MKTQTPDSQTTMDNDVMALARTAFQHARAGEVTNLAWLIDSGLPVNLSNEKGDTLLMLASYLGQEGAARVLLERGADPERTNDRGQTPLAGVAFKGNAAMAR